MPNVTFTVLNPNDDTPRVGVLVGVRAAAPTMSTASGGVVPSEWESNVTTKYTDINGQAVIAFNAGDNYILIERNLWLAHLLDQDYTSAEAIQGAELRTDTFVPYAGVHIDGTLKGKNEADDPLGLSDAVRAQIKSLQDRVAVLEARPQQTELRSGRAGQ